MESELGPASADLPIPSVEAGCSAENAIDLTSDDEGPERFFWPPRLRLPGLVSLLPQPSSDSSKPSNPLNGSIPSWTAINHPNPPVADIPIPEAPPDPAISTALDAPIDAAVPTVAVAAPKPAFVIVERSQDVIARHGLRARVQVSTNKSRERTRTRISKKKSIIAAQIPPPIPKAVGRQQQRSGPQAQLDSQLQVEHQEQEAPNPPPLPVACTRIQTFSHIVVKRKHKSTSSSPDIQVLQGHRELRFWKEKYFDELHIGAEADLVVRAAALFDKSTIQTVVPNRYVGTVGRTKRERHQIRNQQRRQGSGGLKFPGTVQILSPGQAVRQAYEEHTASKLDITRLVLWTDGSGGSGLAVAWRQSAADGWGRWHAAGYKSIGESIGSSGMEHLAVIKALDMAREIVLQPHSHLKAVAIYTDAAMVLSEVQNFSGYPLAKRIIQKARVLTKLGITLSFHWCPGHSMVPGNELADKISKIAKKHSYKGMKEVVDLSDDSDDDWDG